MCKTCNKEKEGKIMLQIFAVILSQISGEKTMNEELKQHVIVHILTINSHKYSKWIFCKNV